MRRPDHYYASNGAKYYLWRVYRRYGQLAYTVRVDNLTVGELEREADGTFTAHRVVSLVRGETWKSKGHRTRKAAADALVTEWVAAPKEES